MPASVSAPPRHPQPRTVQHSMGSATPVATPAHTVASDSVFSLGPTIPAAQPPPVTVPIFDLTPGASMGVAGPTADRPSLTPS
eukprot:6956613-Alexandrium_andersonii.AAC.1